MNTFTLIDSFASNIFSRAISHFKQLENARQRILVEIAASGPFWYDFMFQNGRYILYVIKNQDEEMYHVYLYEKED